MERLATCLEGGEATQPHPQTVTPPNPQPSTAAICRTQHRTQCCGFRVSASGFFWASVLGFRVSGFGSRVAGFGSRASGLGFRVSGLGAPGSGRRWRGARRPQPQTVTSKVCTGASKKLVPARPRTAACFQKWAPGSGWMWRGARPRPTEEVFLMSEVPLYRPTGGLIFISEVPLYRPTGGGVSCERGAPVPASV